MPRSHANQRRPVVTRSNLIAFVLTVLIVVGTVLWIASRWELYARILTGLWPLLIGCMVALVSLLEVAWWLRFDPWYYQFGPKTCAEEWQAAGTDDQIRSAIRPILNSDHWVGREFSAGFFVRRESFWRYGSRVSLQLETKEQGTAVKYEVRPLLTAPLWLLTAGALWLSPFRVFFFVPPVEWLARVCFGLVVIWTVAYYIWLAPHEAKRLGRVKHIRHALAIYRLGVCEKCGYDLTGNVSGVCPECGKAI